MLTSTNGQSCVISCKAGKYHVSLSSGTNSPAVITAVERLSHGHNDMNTFSLMACISNAVLKELRACGGTPLEIGSKKTFADETHSLMEAAHAKAAHPYTSPVYNF